MKLTSFYLRLPAFLSMFAVLTGSAVAEPMSFKVQRTGGNCNTCEWIQASGEIMLNSADVFRAFLVAQEKKDGFPSPTTLRLNSPGGSLAGGIALGFILREKKFSTEVGGSELVKGLEAQNLYERTSGSCLSACAYAYLGGVDRTLDAEAKLGFHQFYDSRALEAPAAKLLFW